MANALGAPFSYEDAKGQKWDAPEGSPIDGASIPKLVWSAVAGTPYTGHYREASVIHDRYCDVPDGKSYKVIARMFYDAMRCEGTGWFEASTKYLAVLLLGPQDSPQRAKKPIPRFVLRLSATPEERAFRSLIDETGPFMSDQELANFYGSLKEQSPSAAKPNTHFVVPKEKILQLEGMRIQRAFDATNRSSLNALNTKSRAEDAPGVDTELAQLTRDLNAIMKTPSGVEIVATDKESEKFAKALQFIGSHPDITPEEVEQLAR